MKIIFLSMIITAVCLLLSALLVNITYEILTNKNSQKDDTKSKHSRTH